MGFVKTGDGEIVNVIVESNDINDDKTQKALEKVTKSLSEKTDTKLEESKDSESN